MADKFHAAAFVLLTAHMAAVQSCGNATQTGGNHATGGAGADDGGACPVRPAGCPSCADVYAGIDGALPGDICYQDPAPPERCQPWVLLEACGRAACWGEADCGAGATFEAPRLPSCTACLERVCARQVQACEGAK